MASSVVGTGQSSTLYEWEIQNYSSYRSLAKGVFISSPVFDIQKRSWHLIFYPNGIIRQSGSHVSPNVSLYLQMISKDTPIKVKLGFSVFNNKKQIDTNYTSNYTYNSMQYYTFSNDSDYMCIHNFFKHFLITTVPFDSITIMCKIVQENVEDKTLLSTSSNKIQHFKAFEGFFNNAQFSDVKLMVKKKEVLAHRIVLTANSKVFAAMFNHEMREKKESIVFIEDVEYEVFCEMLRFMYTGVSRLTRNDAKELLKASDKYELLELKGLCEENMCKNFSTNNVIEYLHLADMHNAQSLRNKAINFIVSHGPEIIEQPEFDSLRNLHPDLFKEVFHRVFKQLKVVRFQIDVEKK